MLRFLNYIIWGTVIILQSNFCFADLSYAEPKDKCSGYVTVTGSSNINHFSFNNINPVIDDSAETKKETGRYQIVKIPAHSFTGSNTRMLNDFLNIIKATDHPFIMLSLDPRDFVHCEKHDKPTYFKTKITIAGVTNTYVLPCIVTACCNKSYIIKGNLEIKLTDFNINPPKRFLGMIKVNNEVSINYAFTFHA